MHGNTISNKLQYDNYNYWTMYSGIDDTSVAIIKNSVIGCVFNVILIVFDGFTIV